MKPKQIKALRRKSRHLSVRLIRPGQPGDPYTAIVGSRSNAAFNHLVTVRFGPGGAIEARCTCPWAEHGGIACSHVIAVLSRMAAQKHRALSFWETPEEAARQKHAIFHLAGHRPEEGIWITARNAA